MSEKTVQVPNISCGHCVKTIERELGGLNGVRAVTAHQDSKDVHVEWDDRLTSWEALRRHLEEIHYPAAE